MHRTILDTALVNDIFRLICHAGLKLSGWKLEGKRPDARRYVIIGAPHTSNWDFSITISMIFCFRMKIFWMGKQSLFNGPMVCVMKWLGGIPVDRSKTTGLVQQLVEKYNEHSDFIVAIAPEGTRSKTKKWKSGFYHVAHEAKVPIALGYLDYKKKIAGFGPMLMPSGNYDEDPKKIQDFYSTITGKNTSQFG